MNFAELVMGNYMLQLMSDKFRNSTGGKNATKLHFRNPYSADKSPYLLPFSRYEQFCDFANI